MARQPAGKGKRVRDAMVEYPSGCDSVVRRSVRDSSRGIDGLSKSGAFGRLHDASRRTRHYKRNSSTKEYWYRISAVCFSGAAGLAGLGATAQAIAKALGA